MPPRPARQRNLHPAAAIIHFASAVSFQALSNPSKSVEQALAPLPFRFLLRRDSGDDLATVLTATSFSSESGREMEKTAGSAPVSLKKSRAARPALRQG